MPSGRRIFVFFCSEHGHESQNFRCVYTAQRFHTAWVKTRPPVQRPHVSFHQLRTFSAAQSLTPPQRGRRLAQYEFCRRRHRDEYAGGQDSAHARATKRTARGFLLLPVCSHLQTKAESKQHSTATSWGGAIPYGRRRLASSSWDGDLETLAAIRHQHVNF